MHAFNYHMRIPHQGGIGSLRRCVLLTEAQPLLAVVQQSDGG